MFNPTSPVTGAVMTGFTTPTYTFVDDVAPTQNGKQKAVTALGGTQTNVTAHAVASPFTLTFVKPKTSKLLGQPNPVTGRIANVGRNSYSLITRKGVTPLAGQPVQPMVIRTIIDVPAGSDTADAANVKAALSAHIGTLYAASAGIGDTVLTGVM